MGNEISIGGISLNVLSIIVTLGIAWGINKKTNESQDEKIKEHQEKINKLFDLRDKHEDETNKERLLFHQHISRLEGMLEFRGRENIEVVKRIEKIDFNVEQMKEDLAYLKASDKKNNG